LLLDTLVEKSVITDEQADAFVEAIEEISASEGGSENCRYCHNLHNI